MKKLVSPGQVVIPSNFPRTRGGPDSRGFRICFAELGRSCSLKQGFLIFTDGSAYSYDTVSNDITEALCAQLQRGLTFNRQFRRAAFGYIRGFTPPADYETIYSYPPYGGVTPAACPLPPVPWPNLTWATTTTADDFIDTLAWSPASGVSDTIELDMNDTATFPNWSAQAIGTCTYNGPAAPGAVALLSVGSQPFAFTSFTAQVIQDGVSIYFQHVGGNVNFSFPGSFMFNDSMGADSVIQVQIDYSASPGFPPSDFVFTVTAS